MAENNVWSNHLRNRVSIQLLEQIKDLVKENKMNRIIGKATIGCAIALIAAAAYFVGHQDGRLGTDSWLVSEAEASGGGQVATGWSPTGVYPDHEVYFPGTEALGPDEMRVIACGSGCPCHVSSRRRPAF